MSLVAASLEKVGMLTDQKFLASWVRSFKVDAGDLIICAQTNVVILNGFTVAIRFDRRVHCHLDSFTVCLSLGLFQQYRP